MRAFSTKLSLLFWAIAASAAQIDTVINDVTALDQDVQVLTAGVRAYNGGLLAQGPLLIDLAQVHIATRKGYYDSRGLPQPLSDADAERLITQVNETLAIDNPIAVQVLKSKKTLFDASGTSPFIKAGLQILLDDHLDFSNEVLERTPQDLLPDANEVVDTISNALQAGIAAFS